MQTWSAFKQYSVFNVSLFKVKGWCCQQDVSKIKMFSTFLHYFSEIENMQRIVKAKIIKTLLNSQSFPKQNFQFISYRLLIFFSDFNASSYTGMPRIKIYFRQLFCQQIISMIPKNSRLLKSLACILKLIIDHKKNLWISPRVCHLIRARILYWNTQCYKLYPESASRKSYSRANVTLKGFFAIYSSLRVTLFCKTRLATN